MGWGWGEIRQKIISLTTENGIFSYTNNLSKGVENIGYNGPLFVTKAHTDNKNSYLQSWKKEYRNKKCKSILQKCELEKHSISPVIKAAHLKFFNVYLFLR